ncbi:hypothetical protein WJX73_010841 [Symbiochloris irregularis]|uniref:Uncharacterized protein n=1 Tax=Symbiochloris irregularis TaxID=706552 RepID=A0AAW1NQX3_9CHLO
MRISATQITAKASMASGVSRMDNRGLIVTGVVATSLFFLIAGWFILLGGVSRVQHVCHSNGLGRCRDRTGLYWWIIWFQFFALFLWPVVTFIEGLRGGRSAVIAIFAILVTLQMLSADNALDYTDDNGFQSGYKTAASGFIILATFNLIAIILLGFQIGEKLDGGDSYGSGGTTTYNNPTAKPTNTSGATSVPDNNPRPFRQASNAHGMNLSQSPPNV